MPIILFHARLVSTYDTDSTKTERMLVHFSLLSHLLSFLPAEDLKYKYNEAVRQLSELTNDG
jgi:hypothetical protein